MCTEYVTQHTQHVHHISMCLRSTVIPTFTAACVNARCCLVLLLLLLLQDAARRLGGGQQLDVLVADVSCSTSVFSW
jgi:hypothetical protein